MPILYVTRESIILHKNKNYNMIILFVVTRGVLYAEYKKSNKLFTAKYKNISYVKTIIGSLIVIKFFFFFNKI